jgi:hypothetical protein
VSGNIATTPLLATPESFGEARRRRLRISSNPSQYQNLGVFIREREIFQELVANSAIPKLLVDVTDRSLEEQANHIADWLEATGGLNPAESPPNPKTKLCAPPNDEDPRLAKQLISSLN